MRWQVSHKKMSSIKSISSISQYFIWGFTLVALFSWRTEQTSSQILNLHPQNPVRLTVLWDGKEIYLCQFWNVLWDLGIKKAQAKGKSLSFHECSSLLLSGFYKSRWRGKSLRVRRELLTISKKLKGWVITQSSFNKFIHSAKIFSNRSSGIPDFVPRAESIKFSSWIISVLREVCCCRVTLHTWSGAVIHCALKYVYLLYYRYLWTMLCSVILGKPRHHSRLSASQNTNKILKLWILFIL